MSRTDKTRPFWVKMMDSGNYVERHNHQNGVCDLPEVSRDAFHFNATSCYFTWSCKFIYSGEARCGCDMCQPDSYGTPRRKRQRAEAKREIREELRQIES